MVNSTETAGTDAKWSSKLPTDNAFVGPNDSPFYTRESDISLKLIWLHGHDLQERYAFIYSVQQWLAVRLLAVAIFSVGLKAICTVLLHQPLSLASRACAALSCALKVPNASVLQHGDQRT